IELFGCTGAGKSTLAQQILQACRSQGVKADLADDFVLQQLRLDWIQVALLRTLVVDAAALVACLLTGRTHARFYLFSFGVIFRLPGEVSWPERLNLARNVLKKTGIDEIVRHHAPADCVIVVDEGTLHAAHNL